MQEANYKVPGGKLLKVKLSVSSNQITQLTILGDFFLHPEDTIEKIEEALIGCTLDENMLKKKIDTVLKENESILVGASSSDIVKVILIASSN